MSLSVVVVGCEGGAAVEPDHNSQSEAMLSVIADCEDGTPHCVIMADFDPNSRPDDLYAFEMRENRCVTLIDEYDKPLNTWKNLKLINLEAGLGREFMAHISPQPDTYLPTTCTVVVSVMGDRLTADGNLFVMEDSVVVHTHRNEDGEVVFGVDEVMPTYNSMDMNNVDDGVEDRNVRCAFQEDVLYLGIGEQETDAITVTLDAAVQFVSGQLPDEVDEVNPHSAVITADILDKITADGNKIVPLPIELADLAVGTADTRCGDYSIKVSWKGEQQHRLPFKLVVDGCADDLLTFRSEPDRFNSR